LEPKAQLERLVRIQTLSLEIRAARDIVENAPLRIEEGEARFRERNAEFVAIQDQHDELEADQKHRTTAVSDFEERLTKFQSGLMEVKNQREYAAMLREIDAVKSEIADNEEAIIKDMEGVERLKVEIGTHKEHIQQEREVVASERKQVEDAADAGRDQIGALSAERESLESDLPAALVASVNRLEHKRQGIFLSKAKNGSCESCFVRVRPQVFQEVKSGAAVHTCSNCRRYLYFEGTFTAAPSEQPPVADGPVGTPGVEQANEGSV
jgi:predicted  nucleic acid-binding Zn-ribbon protein